MYVRYASKWMEKGGIGFVKAVNQEIVEIKQLLRDYKVLYKTQVRRYFKSVSSDKFNKIVSSMSRQRLVYFKDNYVVLNKGNLRAIDEKRLKAFWALLELGDVEYHCPGDWPVQIHFLQGQEEGEIIYAALGEERLINANLQEEGIKRIIIVEEPDQIMELEVSGVEYYCTVDGYGNLAKYIKE